MTQRWKLTIEYDGSAFVGWQWQENGLSVQGCLQNAIHAFCGETPTIYAAGRTDTGVHAYGQVAHIDLERPSTEKDVRDAINAHLRPHPVAVVSAEPVAQEFHARFGAVKRAYCYKILMARRAPPVILRDRVWNVGWELDTAAMQQAANYLIGHHDFTSFRAAECQAKSPMRTLDRLQVIETVHDLSFGRHIEIWAEARSFLHHQIRNITGTLKLVGEGKWSPQDVKAALDARDRAKAGPMAPAQGLYFVRVGY